MNNVFEKFKDFALTEEQASQVRGGTSRLEYCATLYMINNCNILSSGAQAGHAIGWGNNSCGEFPRELLYENAPSDMSGC
jgi:hypothetical protein